MDVIDMSIPRWFHRLEKEEELWPHVPRYLLGLILAPTIVFMLVLNVSV